jgi:hypothetical protein
MLEFHSIIERWLLAASEGPLPPWKAALTRAHLRGCASCRGFAMELLHFTGDLGSGPGQDLPEIDGALLHAQVMAAFNRERSRPLNAKPAASLYPRSYYGVTPRFAKAMGLAALGVGLIVMLAQPFQKSGQDSSLSAALKRPTEAVKAALPVEPSATPTASASATPTPSPTPQPPVSPLSQKPPKP